MLIACMLTRFESNFLIDCDNIRITCNLKSNWNIVLCFQRHCMTLCSGWEDKLNKLGYYLFRLSDDSRVPTIIARKLSFRIQKCVVFVSVNAQ